MSWSVDLLIIIDKPFQVVAEDIGQFLSLSVEKMEDGEEIYSLWQLEANLIVSRNDFVDDRDLNLEYYDILVTIWSTKLPDWEASEEECRKIGVKLFEMFRETYGTGLLLAEQAQTRLLTFDPALQ